MIASQHSFRTCFIARVPHGSCTKCHQQLLRGDRIQPTKEANEWGYASKGDFEHVQCPMGKRGIVKVAIEPSEHDLHDAIDHAFIGRYDTPGCGHHDLDDFVLSYVGELDTSELCTYDADITGWLQTRKGDPSSLDGFRGTAWDKLSAEWLKMGIPPIVVITVPGEDGVLVTQVGDGIGRANFAHAHSMNIQVWHLDWIHNS